MVRKNIFRHLYTWVLLAILAGALLGYFYPTPPSLYLTADGAVLNVAPSFNAVGLMVIAE